MNVCHSKEKGWWAISGRIHGVWVPARAAVCWHQMSVCDPDPVCCCHPLDTTTALKSNTDSYCCYCLTPLSKRSAYTPPLLTTSLHYKQPCQSHAAWAPHVFVSLKRDKMLREKPIILAYCCVLSCNCEVKTKQITLCLFSFALFFSAGHFIIISLH